MANTETNTKEFAGHNIKLPIQLNCDVADEKTKRKREGEKINMEALIVELVEMGLRLQNAQREDNPERAVKQLLKKKKIVSG